MLNHLYANHVKNQLIQLRPGETWSKKNQIAFRI